MRLKLILLACLSAALVLSSCNNSRKAIAGKWKAENSDAVWEFFENGTLDSHGAPGRYSFGDGSRLKIQTGAATFVYQLEFQNERMIWKDPNGSKMELIRVK